MFDRYLGGKKYETLDDLVRDNWFYYTAIASQYNHLDAERKAFYSETRQRVSDEDIVKTVERLRKGNDWRNRPGKHTFREGPVPLIRKGRRYSTGSRKPHFKQVLTEPLPTRKKIVTGVHEHVLNYDFIEKNRSRTWKRHRRTQYKVVDLSGHVPTQSELVRSIREEAAEELARTLNREKKEAVRSASRRRTIEALADS